MLSRILLKAKRTYEQFAGISIDSVLKDSGGVIHIGADGAEKEFYAANNVPVIWFEALPEIYEKLVANISTMPNQKAYCSLLSDVIGKEVDFHIASNDGHSSSMLPFAEHESMFPGVVMERVVRLTTTTLDEFVSQHSIDLTGFDAMLLDTQGTELMVLRGATKALSQMKYVVAEAANFAAYDGCCRMEDLTDFLRDCGFELAFKQTYYLKIGLGTYYNVLFKRARSR